MVPFTPLGVDHAERVQRQDYGTSRCTHHRSTKQSGRCQWCGADGVCGSPSAPITPETAVSTKSLKPTPTRYAFGASNRGRPHRKTSAGGLSPPTSPRCLIRLVDLRYERAAGQGDGIFAAAA